MGRPRTLISRLVLGLAAAAGLTGVASAQALGNRAGPAVADIVSVTNVGGPTRTPSMRSSPSSASSAAAASAYRQRCGPGTSYGRNAIFGIQTTRTPAVTWGWFIAPGVADAIFAENPFFQVTWNNRTTVNGRAESGPGPKSTGVFYTYHSSIQKLNNGRSLKFGDKVHIENWVFGADKNITVRGHLDFYCTVKRRR